jgi:prepilin-type N-terminal cleavage/methylation domain-containing protein
MNHFSKGFTIVELLVVVIVLGFLSTIALTDFSFMKKQSDVDVTYEGLLAVIRLAKSKAVASDSNSRWGVYIDTSVSPVKYTLYKGSTYATRITSADQKYYFSKGVKKNFPVPPAGQANVDISFEKVTGKPVTIAGFYYFPATPIFSIPLGEYYFAISSSAGNSTMPDPVRAIFIDEDGTISSNWSVPTDSLNLVQDSRHLVFYYNRIIDAANETISFNYNNSQVVHTYPLSAYTSFGCTSTCTPNKTDITDTATINGSLQTVRFRVFVYNFYFDPITGYSGLSVISTYRDRRDNNQPVKITLSGDNTGSLVEYDANGIVTATSSYSYVNSSVPSYNYDYHY